MSKNPTRNDTTCLNCQFTAVTDRYCPKCGQENIESHLSFAALAYHAIEDLTHYDNAFWKTIRYILFHPAKLTQEYLSGKRKRFVPPIKLYIFISFITFFLPAILPPINPEIPEGKTILTKKTEISDVEDIRQKEGVSVLGSPRFKSAEAFQKYQDSLPEQQKYGRMKYAIIKGVLVSSTKNHNKMESEKFEENYFHHFPKAIFLYLPIFGFLLWLFHNKKKWYFFDHAIFTFHYFSFILLILTISITILERLYNFIPNESVRDFLSNASGMVTVSWIVVYFFIAHKRIYKENSFVSFAKASVLFFINMILFSLLMLALAFYSLVSIH